MQLRTLTVPTVLAEKKWHMLVREHACTYSNVPTYTRLVYTFRVWIMSQSSAKLLTLATTHAQLGTEKFK